MAEAISLKETCFYMRNVRTRMPFRYGATSLVSVPILHVGVTAELGDSTPARGWAADILPPKWFDKAPEKNFEKNIDDLVAMARSAAVAFAEVSVRPRSLFNIWLDAGEAIQAAGRVAGLNQLTSGHGSSLLERALIDAIGTARGIPYHELLRKDFLGIDLPALHPELKGMVVNDAIASEPLTSVAIRHTVGLVDPICDNDISVDERLDDGLPQSLEQYINRDGIRFLKVKVNGDLQSDLERLRRIAALLASINHTIAISLDGNEQYTDIAALQDLLDAMQQEGNLRALYERIIYIEQPVERSQALDTDLERGIREVAEAKPIVIDESDDDVDSFKRAARMGYNGVSAKNCKGLIKALANKALASKFSAENGRAHFMTGEDLMNLPVVPLQQDLAQAAVLGINHVERNGHHYVRGLDHLSPSERSACQLQHGFLYRQEGDMVRLDIRDGSLDLRSLQVAGLGLGVEVDYESMIPLDAWRFNSL